jgi:hypothetical protein
MDSKGNMKLQGSVDFIMSYGISILIIAISIYIILNLGVFNDRIVPQQCFSAPSFFCGGYSLSANGILAIQVGQTTGSEISVTGIACSSTANGIADTPEYGNIFVTKALAYYPNNNLGNTITIYTDNVSNYIDLYCYSGFGTAALPAGTAFTGFVWLNYSVPSLPNHYVKQVISLTVKSS